MSFATFDAFERCTQKNKTYFPGCFEGMWGNLERYFNLDWDGTKKGMECLQAKLENLKEHYLKYEKNISAKHTEVFETIVDKIIDSISSRGIKEHSCNS